MNTYLLYAVAIIAIGILLLVLKAFKEYLWYVLNLWFIFCCLWSYDDLCYVFEIKQSCVLL